MTHMSRSVVDFSREDCVQGCTGGVCEAREEIAQDQRPPPSELVDKHDASKLSTEGDQRIPALPAQRLRSREAKSGKNLRRVVLKGADTSHLDRELDHHTEEKRTEVAGCRKEFLHAVSTRPSQNRTAEA